jgi:hypothetical protein
MASDSLSIVKGLLQRVLEEFDVTYIWSEHANRLSVEVWVNSKRLIHTYSHTAYAAAGTNCAADLRRKLMSLNASLKQPRPVLQNAADDDVPLSVAISSDKAVEATVEEATMDQMVEIGILADDATKTSHATFPDETRASPSSILVADVDSRLLHHTVILEPAEVIVIELAHDLMVPKGNVLIIPLHDPNRFLDMPKTQYQAFFRQVAKPVRSPPVPTPAAAEAPLQKKVQPSPRERERAKDVGLFSPPPVQAPPPPLSETHEPIALETSSVEGISAQVARQMAAIAYVQHHINNGKPVRISELYDFLDERDRKQVSARMPHAWRLGFADRHEANGGRSLQYGINKRGVDLLSRMHAWPWLREKLPVPKWANF